MNHKLLFLLFIFVSPSIVHAQWTKEETKGFYKLSAWYLEADQHYTDTGDIDPNATRGQFNVNIYAEYGLTDELDFLAYIPFFSRTYQNDIVSGTTSQVIMAGEELNSFGDIDLGVRYGILQKRNLAWSAEAL